MTRWLCRVDPLSFAERWKATITAKTSEQLSPTAKRQKRFIAGMSPAANRIQIGEFKVRLFF